MADFFRYIGSIFRCFFGLQPAGYQGLMAQRGHFGTRGFHRHSLNIPKAGYLDFGDQKLPLINFGAGGISVAADQSMFLNLYQAGGRFQARLSIMGISRHLTFSVAYLHTGQVGLRFENLSREDELFLKVSLQYLDYGLILQTLSKQQVSPAFRSPNWNSYGLEDHTVVVHLNISLQGILHEAQVSYRNGFRHEIVIFNRQSISVFTSPRKKLSIYDKKRILRNALLIIIGLRQVSETDRFDRLISSGITRLFKKDSSPTQKN